MKKALLYSILLIVAVWTVVSLASCRSTRTTRSAEAARTDTATSSKIDATAKKTIEEKETKLAETVKKTTDKTETAGKVSIKLDADTAERTITIKAGDYFYKPATPGTFELIVPRGTTAVDITGTRTREETDSSAVRELLERLRRMQDSLRVLREDSAHRTTETAKATETTKKTGSVVGALWAAGILAASVLLFLLFFGRRRREQ